MKSLPRNGCVHYGWKKKLLIWMNRKPTMITQIGWRAQRLRIHPTSPLKKQQNCPIGSLIYVKRGEEQSKNSISQNTEPEEADASWGELETEMPDWLADIRNEDEFGLITAGKRGPETWSGR